MNIRKLSGLILLILIFIGGATGGYLYFSKVFTRERQAEEIAGTEEIFSLRIYYPVEDRLRIEERRLPKRTAKLAIAEAAVEEYLKGPAGTPVSNIPKDVRLLSLYKDTGGMLYVDLSDEFRRNFQGDALMEILLLKGLYESLISNIPDIQDIKVLIEGKEIETLGGHLYLSHPLKDMVSQEISMYHSDTKNNES